MEQSPLRQYFPAFAVLGLAITALLFVVIYRDHFREWKQWQRAYVGKEKARASTPEQRETAGRIPVRIQQIVLPDLGKVDRCVTCHVPVEDPSYSGLPQPLAYHPNHEQHPFERFGCTICHRGQGRATTRDAAHGRVPHWESPMLSMEYIESSCAKCHHASDLSNAPKLSRGRRLFEESGCIGCHKLKGTGGAIGPELSKVGSKRSPEWLMSHFKDPASVSPGSAMPPIKASVEDLKSLTLYILSLTGEKLTEYYLSSKIIPDTNAGRLLFQEKGCMGCHRVKGRGGKVGPALDNVARRRTPKWIDAHFKSPQSVSPGTVMPGFRLTEQERRALTRFLLSLSEPGVIGYLKLPSARTPQERGRSVFTKFGCAGCHGKQGEGGVPNPNSQTDGQIPGLKFVAEGFSEEELKKITRKGKRSIEAQNKNLPPPPLYMPAWGEKMSEQELDDLAAYLMSLLPKDAEMDW